MKRSYTLLSVLLITFLCSCGIEKRLYRPGFYIPGHSAVQQDRVEDRAIVSCDSTLPACNSPEIVEEAAAAIPEDTAITAHTPAESSAAEQIFRRKIPAERTACSGIVQLERTITQVQKNSGWDRDTWVGIGGIIMLAGLASLLIGLLIELWNPWIGQALIIGGLSAMLAGLLTIGIADPDMFFEFLIRAIFEGLINSLG